VFETRPLLIVSGTAAVLVAIFITAMTMFEAATAGPSAHGPALTGSLRGKRHRS
jgi:hypothetical protein